MAKRKYVRIRVEHQLIVLGQFGNLRAKMKELEKQIVVTEEYYLLTYLREMERELDILEKYFPKLSKNFPQFGQPKSEDGK